MRVLFDGKMDSLNVKIRYLEHGDLDGMLKYINLLSKERTFVSYQGEKVTGQEEIGYIAGQLEKMRTGKGVHLVVEFDSRIVGSSQVELGNKTSRHLGRFSIALLKDFRGKGIGRKLMELTVEQAVEHLPDLEIITLTLFGKNETAKEIYKKFGFMEFGKLPDGVKLEDSYDEYIYMFKKVKPEGF